MSSVVRADQRHQVQGAPTAWCAEGRRGDGTSERPLMLITFHKKVHDKTLLYTLVITAMEIMQRMHSKIKKTTLG